VRVLVVATDRTGDLRQRPLKQRRPAFGVVLGDLSIGLLPLVEGRQYGRGSRSQRPTRS
jgi:hypothetical protein